MKATVVVSCFNQEKYIQECLDSILTQQVDFDFDILVADDCSTDSTLVLIKEYQKNYKKKITIIERNINIGAAKNYIDAHKQATGDVVFHIDGDDVMLPGKLQRQFDVFRDNDKVNIVFHRAQYFSDDGTYNSDTGSPSGLNEQGVLYFNAEDLACWGTVAVHGSYAYRKLSRKFARGNSDFMEWFFAMESLLPKGLGVYLDEILIKYRCNLEGSTYLSTPKGRKRAYSIYFNDLFYYFLKYPDLRKNLYANALVTAGGMLRSRLFLRKCGLFFIRNMVFFQLSQLKKAAAMRRAVAPAKKIR